MIKSWKDKGLKKFFENGDKPGILPRRALGLPLLLFRLVKITKADYINISGNDYHILKSSGEVVEGPAPKADKASHETIGSLPIFLL